MARRSLTILTALLSLSVATQAAATEFFLPGNEAAVMALLRPYSDETLRLEGWSLETLEAGPACAVRMGFVE